MSTLLEVLEQVLLGRFREGVCALKLEQLDGVDRRHPFSVDKPCANTDTCSAGAGMAVNGDLLAILKRHFKRGTYAEQILEGGVSGHVFPA